MLLYICDWFNIQVHVTSSSKLLLLLLLLLWVQNGETALHIAVIENRLKIAKLLLESGVKKSKRTKVSLVIFLFSFYFIFLTTSIFTHT